MENFLEELNVQRRATIENIEKSFGIDIEKARSGVYADTAENRKLNRVGQHYGGRKQEQPTAGQPRAKKQEDEPKGGSEKKPDAGSKADIYSKMSDDEKLQINKVLKFAKDNGFNDISKIEIKSDFNGSEKTLDFYYDGKNIANVGKSITEDTARKIGWLDDDSSKDDGNKGSSGDGENNNSSDEVIDKWVDFWEENEDNDDYDDYQNNLEKFFFEIGEKIKNGEIDEKKYSDYFDDNIGGDYTYKDVERHYKSLLREKRGKRAEFLFDLKNDGASNSIDNFLDRNKKYFKDILDKYNVKDLYELEEKFEKEYEDDEDDPHGYEKYSKIYLKCANKIPLSAF